MSVAGSLDEEDLSNGLPPAGEPAAPQRQPAPAL